MRICLRNFVLNLVMIVALSGTQASADVINFTGGTAHFGTGGTATTNGSTNYGNVDYYDQAGYRFDYIGDPSSQYVGNYYGTGQDVLHGHFLSGLGLQEIRVTKIDGSAFNLNSFTINADTTNGGGPASGNEVTFINASYDGSTIGYSMQLPSENWNGPPTLVTLGAQFQGIKYFSFTAQPNVFCFGIDDVNVSNVSAVPEPSSLALAGLGGIGLIVGAIRRRRGAAV